MIAGLTLHTVTTAVLIAIPLAGLVLVIAALVEAYVPHQPVTKERNHGHQEDTRTH